MAKQAVTVKKETPVSTVPAFMKNDAALGRESIDNAFLTIPRISLMHATSVPVVDKLVDSGHYWHNNLQQDLGEDVQVIPVFIERGFTLWNPAKNANEVLARGRKNANGIWVWEPSNTKFKVEIDKKTVEWDTAGSISESGLAKWDDKNPPPAKESVNILFAAPEVGPEVFGVMTFSKTAFGIGKKLVQNIHSKAGMPVFGLRYRLSSSTATSKEGDKHLVPKWTPDGLVDDERVYESCKAMYEKIRHVGLSGAGVEEDSQSAEITAADEVKEY